MSTRIRRHCRTCNDSLDVPNKGLGRATAAIWMTQHQPLDGHDVVDPTAHVRADVARLVNDSLDGLPLDDEKVRDEVAEWLSDVVGDDPLDADTLRRAADLVPDLERGLPDHWDDFGLGVVAAWLSEIADERTENTAPPTPTETVDAAHAAILADVRQFVAGLPYHGTPRRELEAVAAQGDDPTTTLKEMRSLTADRSGWTGNEIQRGTLFAMIERIWL